MPGTACLNHDVIVVGAGWTGLIAAKTYLDLAPDTNLIILDEGKSIGGVWCKERLYPDLYAQVSYPLFQYSFYDMPKQGISRDGYISGDTIHTYLKNFARDFNLEQRIKLQTKVNTVERTGNGGWRLSIDGGKHMECQKLIWAIGTASHPVMPVWDQAGFSNPIFHSAETGQRLEQIATAERATVVGGAKSALDTVYLLLKSGKKVDWIIREDGAGTIAMVPPSLFGIWNMVDVVSTRAVASFSASIMNTSGWWYSFIHQTRLGRLTANGFWRFLTHLSDHEAGYSSDENFGKLRPTPHGYGTFWVRAGLGTASAPDFWDTLHGGDLTVHRSEIESLSHTDVVNLKNGISLQSDMVIACTGFDKPHSPFGPDLRHTLGLSYDDSDSSRWALLDEAAEKKVDALLPVLKQNPLAHLKPTAPKVRSHGPTRHYRAILPLKLAAKNDRSICFLGQIHSIFTPTTNELGALWAAAYLQGKLELPSLDDMEMEVATFHAWERKRYLEMGLKNSYCILDFLSYIDTLARDLGIKSSRKSNPFSEMFVRYKPSDYRGLIDEFLAAQNKIIKTS
ncbi:FAD/NAD(P)-binding domain-containing protein [Xylaria cf. heliscus]|nr:FAD/NAD(P)-binding domain-containing protein [Xylaria cf. heliscus]